MRAAEGLEIPFVTRSRGLPQHRRVLCDEGMDVLVPESNIQLGSVEAPYIVSTGALRDFAERIEVPGATMSGLKLHVSQRSPSIQPLPILFSQTSKSKSPSLTPVGLPTYLKVVLATSLGSSSSVKRMKHGDARQARVSYSAFRYASACASFCAFCSRFFDSGFFDGRFFDSRFFGSRFFCGMFFGSRSFGSRSFGSKSFGSKSFGSKSF